MTDEYSIRYTVTATTELDAITKAVAMLRADTSLIAVQSAERVGFVAGHLMWDVRLKVAEGS